MSEEVIRHCKTIDELKAKCAELERERDGKEVEVQHLAGKLLLVEAEFKALEVERDSLREQLKSETRDLAEHWAILAEQRRGELWECRKDAERYQYLRNIERRECLDLTGPEAGVWCDAENEMGELLLLTEDDLDAAIDKAMEAKP